MREKAGALEATGDYICCVDGDDYIAENYIEEFEKKINETEAEIVCCGHQSRNSGKTDIYAG